MVVVTVIVVERVVVIVSFRGPDATITATTIPNPSASPEVMIRPIVVARRGGAPGESSTPLRISAGGAVVAALGELQATAT